MFKQNRGSYRGGQEASRDNRRDRGGGYDSNGKRGYSMQTASSVAAVFRQDGIPLNPDPGVRSIEDEIFKQQTLDLTALSISEAGVKLPHRPAYGTRGRPITLWTNYFEVFLSSGQQFNCYAIDILPVIGKSSEKPNGKKRQRCVQLLLRQLPSTISIATDYKTTIVAPYSLGFKSREFGISYSGDDNMRSTDITHYQATVKFTMTLTVRDLLEFLSETSIAAEPPAYKNEIIQAMNIIVGHSMKQKDSIIAKQNKYFLIEGPLKEQRKLGVGLEAFRGFFLSVRAATGRILLNTQVKHIATYQPMKLDGLINRLLQDGQNWSEIDRFIHKLNVRVRHLPYNVQVIGLASRHDGIDSAHPPIHAEPGVSSSKLQFYHESARMYISLTDYFQKEHHTLQNLHTVVVNVGTRKDPRYMPSEVCYIKSGQSYKSKLSSGATSEMVKFAVRQPVENAKTIVTNGAKLVQDYSGAMLQDFGIKVN